MKKLTITAREKARRAHVVRDARVNAAIEGQQTPAALDRLFPAFERGELDAIQVVDRYRDYVTATYGSSSQA